MTVLIAACASLTVRGCDHVPHCVAMIGGSDCLHEPVGPRFIETELVPLVSADNLHASAHRHPRPGQHLTCPAVDCTWYRSDPTVRRNSTPACCTDPTDWHGRLLVVDHPLAQPNPHGPIFVPVLIARTSADTCQRSRSRRQFWTFKTILVPGACCIYSICALEA